MKSLPKGSEVEKGKMEARTKLKSQISRQISDGCVGSKGGSRGKGG